MNVLSIWNEIDTKEHRRLIEFREFAPDLEELREIAMGGMF